MAGQSGPHIQTVFRAVRASARRLSARRAHCECRLFRVNRSRDVPRTTLEKGGTEVWRDLPMTARFRLLTASLGLRVGYEAELAGCSERQLEVEPFHLL